MGTTRSSFSRLLRAAAFHRTTTTTSLHSHSSNPRHFSSTSRSVHTRATTTTLLRPHHHTSPSSFLRSQYPSNHHVFSTISRRVHRPATAVQNPQTQSSIWPYAITFGCIAATGLTVFYKFQQNSAQDLKGSANLEEMELRFQCSFPSLFRKGHSVVVEYFTRPHWDDEINDDNVTVKGSRNWEFYLSATEVLAKPKEINAAMERNKKIIAEKLKIVKEEEEQKIVEKEKLEVAEEENEAAVDWYTTADPLKPESKAISPQLVSTMTEPIKEILVMFRGIPDVLREGDSVFIKWFNKPITDEIKGEDKSAEVLKFYEVMQDKLVEIKKDKSAKIMTFKYRDTEFHYSVDVLDKNDEKYMPQDVAAVIIAE